MVLHLPVTELQILKEVKQKMNQEISIKTEWYFPGEEVQTQSRIILALTLLNTVLQDQVLQIWQKPR